MIVFDRYKYMLHHEGEHREQLIDLLTDPGEMRNALHDPQHNGLLADLRANFANLFPDDSGARKELKTM